MLEDIQIDEKVRALEEDNDFKLLLQKYESPNCFTIIGETRREEWHSNCINWLLNPKGNHNLDVFPLKNF